MLTQTEIQMKPCMLCSAFAQSRTSCQRINPIKLKHLAQSFVCPVEQSKDDTHLTSLPNESIFHAGTGVQRKAQYHQ